MKHFESMLALLVFISLSTYLAGCDTDTTDTSDTYSITSATPATNTPIKIKFGESVKFSVTSDARSRDDYYYWTVGRQLKSSDFVDHGFENEIRKRSSKTCTFTASHENTNTELWNQMKIRCQLLKEAYTEHCLSTPAFIPVAGPCYNLYFQDFREWDVQIIQEPPVWKGNYEIKGKEDILALKGFTEVTGKVLIESNAAVNDLDGLESLTTIGKDLIIRDLQALTDIDGLRNLTEISGDLIISENPMLTTIDGLSSLITVGGHIEIFSNELLTHIDGLTHLAAVGGDIKIITNAALTNINGLIGLSELPHDVVIQNNSSLTNLDGFANVTSVGVLDIKYNSALTDLGGLSHLTAIEESLYILKNDSLKNLDGLANLENVGNAEKRAMRGNNLIINENKSLIDIDGIQNVNVVSTLTLQIVYNPLLAHLPDFKNITSLETLQIYENDNLTSLGFSNLTQISNGYISIYGNQNLCTSAAEALAAQITGSPWKVDIFENKDCSDSNI